MGHTDRHKSEMVAFSHRTQASLPVNIGQKNSHGSSGSYPVSETEET